MNRPLLVLLVIGLVLPAAYAAKKVEKVSVTAAGIEEFFQIYLLTKERRSKYDRVVIKKGRSGKTVTISYWRSLQSRDPSKEMCNAYRWLFFGRGTYGRGAKEAFGHFTDLRKIYLRFFDYEFGTKLGKKRGEVLATQRVIPYLKLGVAGRSLARKKVNWKHIENQMKKGRCAQVGNPLLDEKWFDKDYLRKAK